ncbi:hypothetical protein HW555_011794 [Spodoptera exigua]|uniref:Uncharacterized protein n=1 Tax=Spodoptera exigua TaxID=7107 RepID=A0A835G6F4_SPOEX|nr:hypothetical protein HW555_011794 [Spodoptera exigua]
MKDNSLSDNIENSEDDVGEDIPQEIFPEEMSDNNDNQQPGNDGNSNHTTRRKKRRRKFEAIVPDLQPFPKKVRLSETLLSSSDERRSISVTSLQRVKKLDVLWMLSHALKIPDTPIRDSKHLQSFIDAFSKFVNPFDASIDQLHLFNISNGKAATQAVQDYLNKIEVDGQKLREQFITECTDSPDRFEKPIPKVKIMNFSNEIVKKTIKSGNKVQEIKMQRDLFGRLLGLSLDYKIDMEKILCYPVTPLPMSMCRVDGSLYQTDKSAIVKCFEKQQKCTDAPSTLDVVIVDGFFLLHTMHDIPATFGGISKKIMSILTAFKAPRVDIVFDQYFSPSIKDYERMRRNEQRTIDFNIIGPSQTRPTDFMKELKNIKFKESFVQFLIDYWATDEMATFIGNTLIKLNYDSCYSYIVKNNVVEMTIDENLACNNHEEADTKIIHHVCKLDTYRKTNVLLKTRFQKFCVTYKANTEDEPFKKTLKNCDPSTLPPCKAELQQHLLRTQYITSIWRNAYLRFPSSLTPNRNGWTLHEDTLHFHWFDGDCMPQSVFDAIVHKNNKQNNIENDTTDNAGVSELDTDESEVDSDSSDEGASTEEQ